MATDQQRAEAKVEQAESSAQDAAARALSWLARALARTREEAQDIWAEAQSVSQSRE